MKRFEQGYRFAVTKGKEMKHQPMRFFWKGTHFGKFDDPRFREMEEEPPKGKWARRFKSFGVRKAGFGYGKETKIS